MKSHPLSSGPAFLGRHRTHDEFMTLDRSSAVRDSGIGVHKAWRGTTVDAGVHLGRMQSHDGKTFDSTGAFLVGELERLDQTMHMPLVSVSWNRDIDVREDVTIADEVSSFTFLTFASAGGLGAGNSIGNGKAWIGKNSTEITGIGVDIGKTAKPLRLWGMEIKYSIPELESAARLGRPIDAQKYEGMQMKHEMDIDEQVYIGDTSTGDTGLLNSTASPNPAATNFPTGNSGSTLWTKKTPDEILSDVNFALTTNWANTGWSVMPDSMLIPPAQFGYIATAKVSAAGNLSILNYILENNLLAKRGAKTLRIDPCKWCIGAGAGGTVGTVGNDRMALYVKERNRIRFPMTLLQRTPVQYDSIYHKSTYFCRLGVMEIPYPETVGYYDLL